MVGETPMVSSDLALVPIKATGVMVEAAHRVEEKEEELLSFERTWEIMIAASPVQLVAVSGAWSPAEWTQAIAKQLGAAHAGCWRCGALSEVLARILSLSGYDAKVVNGLANGTAHAWVEVEGVVYDATAEQFAAPIAYERGPDFLQSPQESDVVRPSSWRSIDDGAPKDGQVILVYSQCFGGAVCLASWDNGKFARKPQPRWVAQDPAYNLRDLVDHPPTHWMPIPAAPAASAAS